MMLDYDGEKIRVVQSKTKARVWIKCHKDLKPHLETAIAEARATGIANGAFLRGVRGEPMGERYFATRWDAGPDVRRRSAGFHFPPSAHRERYRRLDGQGASYRDLSHQRGPRDVE